MSKIQKFTGWTQFSRQLAEQWAKVSDQLGAIQESSLSPLSSVSGVEGITQLSPGDPRLRVRITAIEQHATTGIASYGWRLVEEDGAGGHQDVITSLDANNDPVYLEGGPGAGGTEEVGARPAYERNGLPVEIGTIVLLEPGEYGEYWIFDWCCGGADTIGEIETGELTGGTLPGGVFDPGDFSTILIKDQAQGTECQDLTISGFVNPQVYKKIKIVSFSQCTTHLVHEDPDAESGDQIVTPSGLDMDLMTYDTATLEWFPELGKWLLTDCGCQVTTEPTGITFVVGTTGTDFAISSVGTTHTFNLPDASLTARGVVSLANQVMGDGDKWFPDKVGFNSVIGLGPYFILGPTYDRIYGTPSGVNFIDNAGVPGTLMAGAYRMVSYAGAEPYGEIAAGQPYFGGGSLGAWDCYVLRSGTVGGTENVLIFGAVSHDGASPHDFMLGAYENTGAGYTRVQASYTIVDPSSGIRLRGQTGTDGVNTFTGGICTSIGTGGAGYTDEQAKDAVGNILTDSATLNFNYDDGLDTITADVKANSITLAMQVDVATSTVFYRKTSGSGSPEVQTLATLKADLGLSGSNTGDETAATILSKLLTVDGAGSGLDADLLDGQSSAAFEVAGTAASVVAAHEAAGDPHPGYLTTAEGNAAYQPLDVQLTSLAGLAYTGNSLKFVRVNVGETGFELSDGPTGGISGPVSSTDNALARWNGTGGDTVQDSLALLADDGSITNYQKVRVHVGVGDNRYIEIGNTSGTQSYIFSNTVGAGVVDFVVFAKNIGFYTSETDFASGAYRWQIKSNGHFFAETDNTYDIGASADNRPRNVYVAGNITAVGDLTCNNLSGTNTGDETAAGILAKLVTVDGPGSGLDADLLDGISSAGFALAGHDHTGTYQPLDGDLTAMAALTGTGTIYYRSAADTWTAVTIGTGLDFTAGTLSATGGGGTMAAQDADAVAITGGSLSGITIDVPYGNLGLRDADGSHLLTIVNDSNLTATRNLRLIPGDADRTITILGDTTISGVHSGASSGTNTGDQTITLTGDVTGSGTGSFTATIGTNKVTTAKILNSNVTYAKIQNVSATARLLGRASAGAGVIEEITLPNALALDPAHTAKMVRNAAQTINNNTVTKVLLNSEIWDVGGIADPTTNNRFNIVRAGKYHVSASLGFASGYTVDEELWLAIYINGALAQWQLMSTGNINGQAACQISEDYNLSVNDYIELYVYQVSGAALGISTLIQWEPRMSVYEIR